jgi:hypothetical protein
VERADAAVHAVAAMTAASDAFERLDEAADWSVAQQKLALAYRARGDLGRALMFLDIAERNRISDSPLQHVRLNTARAHILMTDRATHDEGLRVIASAREIAMTHGLHHQIESIQRIHAMMTAY